MKMLSKAQIIALHGMTIRQTGGSAGLRDEGALDAVLAAPFQTFGGNALYPSIKAKIARLGYGNDGSGDYRNRAFLGQRKNGLPGTDTMADGKIMRPEQSGLFCLRKPTENLWASH